jgi:transposase
LEDRANGVIKRGKAPTVDSVQRQCSKYLKRQHMKHVINIEITTTSTNVPKLAYKIDNDALHDLSKTYLGKNILITNCEDWDDTKIITAYRSQFLIEDVFKEMKDRSTGNWWPMLHWTDSKIKVHGLYCTIAVLIRALMARRVAQTGLRLPMKRILLELDGIREVINIYPRKGRQKVDRRQSVLSKLSETQEQLMSVLQLKHGENSVLG